MKIRKLFAFVILTLGLVAAARAANRTDKEDCANGNPQVGIAACTRIINAKAGTPHELAIVYVRRGNAYAAKRDYDQAILDYTAAIKLDPKDKDAYVDRGDAFQARGDHDKAIADENEAIKLDPKYKSAYVDRGNAFQSIGDYDKAIADYTMAIKLYPKSAIGYFNRGNAYRSEGKYGLAAVDFSAAIKLAPKFADAFFYRGVANMYAGALPKALADFKKASALNPTDPYAALWLDIVATRSKRPSRLPKQAAHLDMTKWPAPVVRLFLHKVKASSVLADAMDSDLATRKGQVCEANFYTGELVLQQGAKDEAERLFRSAAADCPKSFNEWFAAKAELKALGKSP
ncbi:tetratricopeptide repeat protein [Methylovirgula sp. HY1]|uniref:tetratricopeptide repeat protein n=1 Tax=Methylovirgula sp. HY1 TaxID=2822761 RepID=UPI001C5AAC26|nr:tetratricopeptide repeat protein [Methylovirgula sp. HY1]QXX74342.1 Lipoprotein NlpI [Methylovirgula sp. HY1]